MTYRISVLTIAGILISGCQLTASTDHRDELRLIVGEGFLRDWVVVDIAGERVLADTLTSGIYETGVCCGPAAEIYVPLQEAKQQVRVRVNEVLEAKFETDPSHVILRIDLNRLTQEVKFQATRKGGIFVYEG